MQHFFVKVGWLKIAVEQRSDRWLAQVVHVGENLHWMKQIKIQNTLRKWVKENCQYQVDNDGWQFYFHNKQDLTVFLLRWHGGC